MKKTLLTLLTATLLFTGSTTVLSADKATQQAKPFLIQGKLPHLTMMVKILWDDEDLALTSKQQKQLLKIRKKTMGTAKTLKIKILKLEDKVVKESQAGAKPETMQKLVKEIASLRVQATMIHLECIYDTRAVLSKDQLYIVE